MKSVDRPVGDVCTIDMRVGLAAALIPITRCMRSILPAMSSEWQGELNRTNH